MLRQTGEVSSEMNPHADNQQQVPRARGRPPNSKNKTSRGAHNAYVPGPEGDTEMLELLEQQERLQQQEPTPIAFPAVYTRPPVPFDNNNYVAHPTPATFPAGYTGPPVPVDNNNYVAHPTPTALPAVYTGPPVPVDNNTYMAPSLALTSSMPEDFMTPMPVLGAPPASSPHTILYPHGQPVDAYGYLPTPNTSRHPSNGSIYDSDSGHGNGSIPPYNDHPGESSYVAAFPSFPHPDDLERGLALVSAPISSAPAFAPAYALAPLPAPAPAYASAPAPAPAPTFMNSRPTQPQPLFIDPALINVGQQQPTPPPATSTPQGAVMMDWDIPWDKMDFSEFDGSKVSTYTFQSEF